MATLTPQEIAYVRLMSGDDCPTYDVGDDMMQYINDNVVPEEPQCLGSIPMGGLIVWVLRARLARAVKLTDSTNSEGIYLKKSQKFDHLTKMVDEWEGRCGLSEGAVTIGSFDLGLDTPVLSQNGTWRYWDAPIWGGWL